MDEDNYDIALGRRRGGGVVGGRRLEDPGVKGDALAGFNCAWLSRHETNLEDCDEENKFW